MFYSSWKDAESYRINEKSVKFEWFTYYLERSWEVFETILDMDLSKKLYFSLPANWEPFCLKSSLLSGLDWWVWSWRGGLETSTSGILFTMIFGDYFIDCRPTCSTFCLLLFLEWAECAEMAEWLEWTETLFLSSTLMMLDWEMWMPVGGIYSLLI
jgi:hypothetical protein